MLRGDRSKTYNTSESPFSVLSDEFDTYTDMRTISTTLQVLPLFEEQQEDAAFTSSQALPRSEEGQEEQLAATPLQVLPLSEEQKELWFVSTTEDAASQAYNQSLGLHLRGSLHISALQEALQALVQRHEALRTVFDRSGTEQRILPSLVLHIEHSNFSLLSGEERERQVLLLQQDEARRLFDLEQGPLLRAHLITMNEQYHILLFTIHHLIADGRSVGTLLRELATLYAATSTQTPPQLQPAFPYSNYVRHQLALEQGEEMKAAESYWLAQFAETPPALEFPTDFQRPPVKTFHGAKHHVKVDRDLYAALKNVGARYNCTLYTTLLAAYSAFLARITGQRDLVVPISSAGQFLLEGGDYLVGHCVRLLPIRIVLRGNPTLHDYLRMVKLTQYEAQEHQIYPFSELVQKLKLPRDPSRVPLVATDFNLDVSGQLHFLGLETEVRNNVTDFAQCDFAINIGQAQDDLLLDYSYNTDLFSRETIERWSRYFLTLLERMALPTTQTFSDLTLLNEREVKQLVTAQQVRQPLHEADSCFIQLFAEQVARTPDAIVAGCEEEHITYRTLNERAYRMACTLHKLGVTSETLVALLADRSIDFLAMILAVWKAGGAYLPLNTHWPEKQYERILERSRVPLVFTTAQYQPKLQAALDTLEGHTPPQVYLLEELSSQLPDAPVVLPAPMPGNLAYVIYTSGSTGTPKGAMVEQQGMLNHLFAKVNELALTNRDVVAQNAAQSFDISVWQFLSGLLVGGRVQIIPDHSVNDPEILLKQAMNYNVSVLEVVPSLLQSLFLLIEATGIAIPDLPHLRWLISTGEALSPKLARQWLATYSWIPVMNGYGPTECSDDVTHHVISEPPAATTLLLPIGHTLPNLELYVLDQEMHMVPPGIPGELYIGGTGVGRGYVHDPSTTARTFVPHPFSSIAGSRLYKTGDHVRLTRDGVFEFLGRIDHQVKVRGFRIELGEIEAHLYKHAAVQEAVVIVREDEPDEKLLVAYIITASGSTLSGTQLRSWLREYIPEYMVPSAFVFLDRLPLTPNGKIDTRALPAPELEQSSESVPGAAPRNPLESLLANIWKSVLHVHAVGVHDNFFELGGDSIMSIKIIARLNEAGFKLSTREIFQYQTIAELAGVVAQKTSFSTEQGEITGQVPLTPIQRAFFELDLPNPHHYNQAMLLEVREAVDLPLLRLSLHQLFAHHDILRSRFIQKEAGWECHMRGYGEEIPFLSKDLSSLDEGEQKAALEAIASKLQASLNITEGPLLRIAYFDMGRQRHARLLLIAHHLIIDTVSWQILLEDLEKAYRQISAGKEIQLPPKTTSFKSWAEHLVQHAQSETLRQEQAYWSGLPWEQVQELPGDHRDAPNEREAMSVITLSLSKDETQALLQEVPKTYRCQINDALLTALVEAFARWTGDTSLLLDMEGHGREEIFDDVNLTRTAGWFTSVTPLLLQLQEKLTPAQAIRAVKEQRQNIPHGGIGAGLLHYLRQNDRKLTTLPRPQIGFNYLGQTTQESLDDALFAPAAENYGATVGKGGTLPYLIDIVCMVEQHTFQIHWIYSESVYMRETVERVARWYMEALRALLAYGPEVEAKQASLYDASLTDLDIQTLNDLLSQVRFDNEQL